MIKRATEILRSITAVSDLRASSDFHSNLNLSPPNASPQNGSLLFWGVQIQGGSPEALTDKAVSPSGRDKERAKRGILAAGGSRRCQLLLPDSEAGTR